MRCGPTIWNGCASCWAEKFAKPVRLVEGGDSRQESVENALATLGIGTELVAVHDAVRPFIEHSVLEKVFAEAEENGAAIVGIVPVDTVKQVHRNKIRQTIPRERLILAQTPQVFRFDLLKQAFAKAREDSLRVPMNPAWWNGWIKWK